MCGCTSCHVPWIIVERVHGFTTALSHIHACVHTGVSRGARGQIAASRRAQAASSVRTWARRSRARAACVTTSSSKSALPGAPTASRVHTASKELEYGQSCSYLLALTYECEVQVLIAPIDGEDSCAPNRHVSTGAPSPRVALGRTSCSAAPHHTTHLLRISTQRMLSDCLQVLRMPPLFILRATC